MFKAILNLCLIIVICITASGISSKVDGFDFSSLLPITQEKFNYSLNIEDTSLKNPTTLNLNIQTSNSKKISLDVLQDDLVLDVFEDNKIIATLNGNAFVQVSSTHPNTESSSSFYTLNLAQKNLDLPNGQYTFNIHSKNQSFKDMNHLNLEVTYLPLSKYIPSPTKASKGMIGLTLYFPDSSNQQLIPLTRFINYTRKPLRKTIEALQSGSDPSIGLVSHIPDIPRLQVQKNRVLVHLSYPLDPYNENPALGRLTLDSLVYSLTSIPDIDQVKFLVDGKESDNIFHGYSTKTIFSPINNPLVYLGLDQNNKRQFLIPQELKGFNENTLYETMIHMLKGGKIDNKDLFSPIPSNIDLINYSKEGNTLTLNFGKEFMNAYPDRMDLQRMMIDAILYSFTSIHDVERIKFLVEDKTIHSFGAIDLSSPLKKPPFINPEKE